MSGFYGLDGPFDSGKTRKRAGMNQKSLSRRGHKLIAFKAFFDTDRDILDWWEGMQDGERSDVLRALLHSYIKGLPMYEAAKRSQIPVDGSTVREVHDNTRWIRDALNDMPAYLERLLERFSLNPAPVITAQPAPVSSGDSLTNDALARRKVKMGKAGW